MIITDTERTILTVKRVSGYRRKMNARHALSSLFLTATKPAKQKPIGSICAAPTLKVPKTGGGLWPTGIHGKSIRIVLSYSIQQASTAIIRIPKPAAICTGIRNHLTSSDFDPLRMLHAQVVRDEAVNLLLKRKADMNRIPKAGADFAVAKR